MESPPARTDPSGGWPTTGPRVVPRSWGRRSPAHSVARWLLAATVLGSVLAVGAVHGEVLLVVAAPAVAAAVILLWTRTGSREGRFRSPAWVFVALAAFSALQAIPVPLGLLRRVAPANADVHARAFQLLGDATAWAPVSLDPGATWIEALRWLTYGLVCWCAGSLAGRSGAAWTVGLVFVASLAAAFTTVAHGLVGATKVFGIYEPTFRPLPWHVGPLLNPNNLAGYLTLGALCGLGLLSSPKRETPAWLLWSGVATVIAVAVLSGSRGGFVCLVVAVATLGLLRWRDRGRRARRGTFGRTTATFAAAVGGGVGLAVLGGTAGVWQDLYNTDLSKLRFVLQARSTLSDFAWLGTGRGAFESVFPAYRTGGGSQVFTHVENWIAQWGIEWGVPISLFALACLAIRLRPSQLRFRESAVATAAVLGLGAVALQNMWDLAFEIPGVCIAVATVAGGLWGAAEAKRARSPAKNADGGSSNRWLAGALAAFGAAAIGIAAWRGLDDVASDRTRVQRRMLATAPGDPAAREAMRRAIGDAVRRHPADPYFPLVGALVAWQAGDISPIPWIQRALERHAAYGRAHLLLADVLASRGALGQARLELRLAVESELELAPFAATRAARWSATFEQLMETVPVTAAAGRVLDGLAEALGAPDRRTLAAQCDRAALRADPSRLGPRLRLAEDLLVALAPSRPADACAGDGRAACDRDLDALVDGIRSASPGTSHAARVRARRLLLDGRAEEAERLLAGECQRVADRLACLRDRGVAAAKLADRDRLAGVVREVAALSCAASSLCAESWSWAGDVGAGRGDWNEALVAYARAAREEPNEERWLSVARAAGRVGAHAQAVHALERVVARRKDDTALADWLERERKALAGSLVGGTR